MKLKQPNLVIRIIITRTTKLSIRMEFRTITPEDFITLEFEEGDVSSKKFLKTEIEKYPVVAGMAGLTGFRESMKMPFSCEILEYCMTVSTTQWKCSYDTPERSFVNIIKVFFPQVASRLMLNHFLVKNFIDTEFTVENTKQSDARYSQYYKWINDIMNYHIVIRKSSIPKNYTYVELVTGKKQSIPLFTMKDSIFEKESDVVISEVKVKFNEFLDELESNNSSFGEFIFDVITSN